MNKQPLVSIIVPVYNTQKYIRDCLISAINQSYSNLEIIVIDDGSPDDSFKIVNEFVKKDNRVQLIRQQNIGLSGARNTGIKVSKGEYLIFLDSDDCLFNDSVESMLKIAIEEDSDIVIPDKYEKHIESTGKKSIELHFLERDKTDDPIDFALKVIIGKGRAWRAHSLLYKSSKIKENFVLFPVGYTQEDIVFNLNLFSYLDRVSFYPHPTISYLKRENSITTSFNKDLINIFLFIDDKVKDFVEENNLINCNGTLYREALLKRNIVLYLTYLFSSSNADSISNKFKKANSIFQIERIGEVFNKNNNYEILPFFSSGIKVLYIKIMYFLLNKRKYKVAFTLAYFGGKRIVKI